MKKVNITFSIPEETTKNLQLLIEKRKMSAFVTKVINEALAKEKSALEAAYKEAETDPDRKKVLADWSDLEAEGWE